MKTAAITGPRATIAHSDRTSIQKGYNIQSPGHQSSRLNSLYAMWLMLQQGGPNDHVDAGAPYLIPMSMEGAFELADLGSEKNLDTIPRCFHSAEVNYLAGNSPQVRRALAWRLVITLLRITEILAELDLEELSRRIAGDRGAMTAVVHA